jgi:ribosome maturation factor RimP
VAAVRDLKSEIERMVTPIVEQEQFELVEIKLSHYRRNYRLQIFVDSMQGVTLGNCAHLSRLIGAALDEADPLDSKYILEISSPGLDRPLVSDRDFRRRVGEEVALDVVEDGQPRTVTGRLTEVGQDRLVLSSEDGVTEVLLANIRQGRIIF